MEKERHQIFHLLSRQRRQNVGQNNQQQKQQKKTIMDTDNSPRQLVQILVYDTYGRSMVDDQGIKRNRECFEVPPAVIQNNSIGSYLNQLYKTIKTWVGSDKKIEISLQEYDTISQTWSSIYTISSYGEKLTIYPTLESPYAAIDPYTSF